MPLTTTSNPKNPWELEIIVDSMLDPEKLPVKLPLLISTVDNVLI
jgi:hypothetical protein